VLAFLVAHIRSANDLALLMAVIDAPYRWWDADRVRRELGIAPAQARASLERLVAANVLDIRITEHVRYQFRPATTEVADVLREFATAFRADRGAVTDAVLTDGAGGARES